jgi:hypothetical protein
MIGAIGWRLLELDQSNTVFHIRRDSGGLTEERPRDAGNGLLRALRIPRRTAGQGRAMPPRRGKPRLVIPHRRLGRRLPTDDQRGATQLRGCGCSVHPSSLPPIATPTPRWHCASVRRPFSHRNSQSLHTSLGFVRPPMESGDASPSSSRHPKRRRVTALQTFLHSPELSPRAGCSLPRR